MFEAWKKRRRRNRIAKLAFPTEWAEHLERNVRYVSLLEPGALARLHVFTRIIIIECEWIGCAGFEVTDEVRVTIAGQAALLLVGHTDFRYCFDYIRAIHIYEDAPTLPADPAAKTPPDREVVALPWQTVLQGGQDPHDGRNIVIFALAKRFAEESVALENRDWLGWLSAAFEEAREENGDARVLDRVGIATGAEFFAVATECFFERPIELRESQHRLYDVLQGRYHLDPALWHGGEDESDLPVKVLTTMTELGLDEDSADADFMRAQFLNDEGKHEEAITALEAAAGTAPDDDEIRCALGRTLGYLGRYAEALPHLDRAIALAPKSGDAHLARAQLFVETKRFEDALADLRKCEDTDDVCLSRGHAWAGRNEYRRAIASFTDALRLSINWPCALRARANAYEALGNLKRAQADRDAADAHD